MTHILVVGTGAVAGLYGCMLSLAKDVTVSFLCRSDYEAILKNGINIQSPWKNFNYKPYLVLKNGDKSPIEFDYILVATKVLPDIDPQKQYGIYVSPKTTILLLQNGIGIEEPVQKIYTNNEILSGLAFTCIHRTSPGVIHHLDYGHISIGSYTYTPSNSARAIELSKLFIESGVPCEASEDIKKSRWKKLVWNAAFNPLSVLALADTERMLLNPNSRNLVENIMAEVCELAKADGHPLPSDTIPKFIDMTLSMKPYKTSMLLDYESHNTMELEAILGNSIQIAKSYSIPVPHIQTIYSALDLLVNSK